MLIDAGIPKIESDRIQGILLVAAIATPFVFLLVKKYFPNQIATRRKLIIMSLTTIIISIQLLLGAVMLKNTVHGFEVNIRLSISLKCLCFVIITALSIGPLMIFEIYSDLVSSHCSGRVNPYSLSNMGCALIRFFTLLPIVIVCALFVSSIVQNDEFVNTTFLEFQNESKEYVPCFTALIPLLSVNLMAYALEQPPKIHLVSDTERHEEDAESQF
uniref:Integral membrane protein n=1 Tax=Caenorhabditis tropicalis TaxID=1561998 RepID=A0A1I7TD26_9PELO